MASMLRASTSVYPPIARSPRETNSCPRSLDRQLFMSCRPLKVPRLFLLAGEIEGVDLPLVACVLVREELLEVVICQVLIEPVSLFQGVLPGLALDGLLDDADELLFLRGGDSRRREDCAP